VPKVSLPKLELEAIAPPPPAAVEPEPLDLPEQTEAERAPLAANKATGELLGAGAAGAVAGGILADILVTSAGIGFTGEVLTDAAAIGAVVLGGGAVYAASRPDEAGEAARFVGGSVANVTTAYAEVAALNAELAILERKRQAMAKVDETVGKLRAAPKRAKDAIEKTVTSAVDAAVAAPTNAANTISQTVSSSLRSAQAKAKAELEAAKRELDKLQ